MGKINMTFHTDTLSEGTVEDFLIYVYEFISSTDPENLCFAKSLSDAEIPILGKFVNMSTYYSEDNIVKHRENHFLRMPNGINIPVTFVNKLSDGLTFDLDGIEIEIEAILSHFYSMVEEIINLPLQVLLNGAKNGENYDVMLNLNDMTFLKQSFGGVFINKGDSSILYKPFMALGYGTAPFLSKEEMDSVLLSYDGSTMEDDLTTIPSSVTVLDIMRKCYDNVITNIQGDNGMEQDFIDEIIEQRDNLTTIFI